MQILDINAGGIPVRVYLPAEKSDTLLYFPVSDAASLDSVLSGTDEPSYAAAALVCDDWDSQLTPWPAPAAFRGNADFSGKADIFLDRLYSEVFPEVEKLTGVPEFRGMAGYSLAGLFSLYAF